MAINNTADSWGSVARTLHWLLFVLVVTLLIVGHVMEGMAETDPRRLQVYGLHKSFGLVVLMLAVLRLWWRLRQTARPTMPAHMKDWERSLATVNHGLLYAALFVMPISGYVMSCAAGYPPKLFGLAVPDLVGKNEALAGLAHTTHVWAGWVVVGLIALHLAGALKHHFVYKDNVLTRMLTGK